ncbi:MAG TPA: amidase [Dehalococcoidia bacterium]|nr:amidase [Dehalococcoidia bacterium]
MTEIALKRTIDLAAMIRDREIGSRELLDHYLDRVERFNPTLNAIVAMDIEGARQRADEADAALARGENWGPLHGLPTTIKELFEVAGFPWTAGDPQFAERIAKANVPAVQRIIDAGAVIFGLTNSPLIGMDVQTYNEVYGTTNNPWDTDRSPGGSSGGTAVALSTGMTGLDIGSDIGGSIRNPAHYSGIYGHKPTFGIVPRQRLQPPGLMGVGDLSVVGPLARSAEDLDFGLSIIAGPERDRASAWSLDLPAPRHDSLKSYRVAAWLDDPYAPVDSAVLDRLHATVEALRGAGVEVDEQARPEIDFAETDRVYRSLLASTGARGLSEEGFAPIAEVEDEVAWEDADEPPTEQRTPALRYREWLHLNEAREQLRARWQQFFESYDVLLMPVTPVTAIPHDHGERQPLHNRGATGTYRTISVNGEQRPYNDQLSWVGLITMVYLPASVAPVGLSADGLPVGVQIVAPYLEDRTAIDFAKRLGEVIGGYQPPPGYE